ncbi:hypothetical protein M378DRAFT_106049 [Amanita muscaria Koide BX008]|uniref:Uncharacterized protein n=1 Tax=Amanita muscaria (strain Koide BX008) TaxID=946122 RepID=A0A0C2X560_AMAMK|nr:hypothetical protein M378DRAFT_106049 [Amanita muscaria Koide BX008]
MTDQTVRPKRTKLRSGDELTSHRTTTDNANLTRVATLPSDDGPTPATTTSTRSVAAPNYSDNDLGSPSELASQRSTSSIARKRSRAVLSDNEDTLPPPPDPSIGSNLWPRNRSNEKTPVIDLDQVDEARFLKDIPDTEKPRYEDRIRDITTFFTAPLQTEAGKKYRNCNECTKKQKKPVSFVNEVTTLRRHMEAAHKGTYLKWAEDHSFISMLPKDAKRRRIGANADRQTRLDSHLCERETKEHVVPYSDALFREAAIRWLIETDQPLDALNHPAFQKMVHLASQATNGVKLPSRKQTRKMIIDLAEELDSETEEKLG